jgi:branched-chain amino acid transport system permease protein
MARFNAVDVVLWVLRIGVVAVVVVGTVSTLIKGRYNAAQWFDFVMFGLVSAHLRADRAGLHHGLRRAAMINSRTATS